MASLSIFSSVNVEVDQVEAVGDVGQALQVALGGLLGDAQEFLETAELLAQRHLQIGEQVAVGVAPRAQEQSALSQFGD